MALFAELWKHHPKTESPCNTAAYANQCAIRLGTALAGAGLNVKRLGAVMCDYHPQSMGHTLRALELAEGLNKGLLSNIGPTKVYSIGAPWIDALRDETGIIFFYHYYNRNRQERPLNGDHIDLWKRTELTRPAYTYEVQARDGGTFNKGQVWFWSVT
jgi:hypothetical protein